MRTVQQVGGQGRLPLLADLQCLAVLAQADVKLSGGGLRHEGAEQVAALLGAMLCPEPFGALTHSSLEPLLYVGAHGEPEAQRG